MGSSAHSSKAILDSAGLNPATANLVPPDIDRPKRLPRGANTPAFAVPIRLIPIERVCEILGLKRSAVLAMAARGELPEKIKFGPKASRRATARWLEHEIVDFVLSLANQRSSSNDAMDSIR